ncbi:MAG: hypothetical protein EON59_14940, partial [Alphaproteobacteria bacterium]
MTSALALTRRSVPLVVLFICMGVSQLVVEPAYIGYILAYGLFAVLCAKQLLTRSLERGQRNILLLGWVAFAGLVFLVTVLARPGFRDLV